MDSVLTAGIAAIFIIICIATWVSTGSNADHARHIIKKTKDEGKHRK